MVNYITQIATYRIQPEASDQNSFLIPLPEGIAEQKSEIVDIRLTSFSSSADIPSSDQLLVVTCDRLLASGGIYNLDLNDSSLNVERTAPVLAAIPLPASGAVTYSGESFGANVGMQPCSSNTTQVTLSFYNGDGTAATFENIDIAFSLAVTRITRDVKG